MMEAIHYEAYLYDAHDERQAQSKWQNVLEFCEWLKKRARSRRRSRPRIPRPRVMTTPMVSAMKARTCSA
ncbi:MAG: ATP-dependent DNA helicase Rep [Candidatus Burkholderia crenata]|nr:MAG: ATP-dependent DNA helicase Rep [Candidatus Burkholderia crenata]